MKVVLLAAASSIHTVRWANGLSLSGHEVHVISQHSAKDLFDPMVKVYFFPSRGVVGYFSMVFQVRKLLQLLQPDIVNAHYASGYGTTARLVGYHPWVLSVWGSDVYEFPYKSSLHKWLVNKNLLSADKVISTSHCMAKQILKLVPKLKNIEITPFGVDLAAYSGIQPQSPVDKAKLVVGTVKTMSPVYGIDILIEAYARLVKRLQSNVEFNTPELELRLVGGGEQTNELRALSRRLGVSASVHFIGHVPHNEVPIELSKLDIYVALSRSESFGVAVIEAGAAGRPVVVSDVGGLPEVTVEGETGFVVPRENPQAAAEALEKLVLDPELRHQMGIAGKNHVANHYSWEICIQSMISVYEDAICNFEESH